MRFIKKYETFNHRSPTHITDAEYNLKMETNKKEPFTDKEIDFFKKLKIDNRSIYELDVVKPNPWGKGCSTVFIKLYAFDDGDDIIEIDITKLTDSWYLIYEVGIDKFICDDWDEVLGYLGTQTILNF